MQSDSQKELKMSKITCKSEKERLFKAIDRQKTEVYSRVVGYIRPVKDWNDSKQEEFKDRVVYDVKPGTVDERPKRGK